MKTKNKVLTKNIFIDEYPKQSNENLQKRIIQIIMLLLILSVPVFAQEPDIPCDEDPDCTVIDTVTVIPWDIGSGGGDNDGGWINPRG